jgi:4-amino-4-deoxy-L-arabinose transferase-like glycosyltransferase
MPDSRKRIADWAFLAALMVYILAGICLTPPHGDEYMFMAMSRDTYYMAHGDWQHLVYTPPVVQDSDQYLRLLNGTINKTLIGIVWMLQGRTIDSLPGVFVWTMPYDWNQRQGNVPSDDDLHTARWPSAILAALGVIPMFFIGWQLRLRSLAYPSALIYALHPVILLNGRRAMLEGSLMFFTLATMAWLLALIVSEHSATAHGFMSRLSPWVRYGVLGILAGLAVASKQTGLVIAVAALLAALLAGVARDRSWRPIAWVGLAGVAALITWFALNPIYWSHPFGAMRTAITDRTELLDQQVVAAGPLAYSSWWQRIQATITQPFLTPPQYYESDTWSGLINPQITAYQSSAIDGWDWGPIIGVVLTLLAGIGLVALCYDALHRDKIAWAILIWTVFTIAASLAVPLGWQRYYLPLMLVAIVLAAEGLGRLVVRRVPEENRQPTVSDVSAA